MKPTQQVVFLTHEPFWPPSGGGSAEAAFLVRELLLRGYRVHLFAPGEQRPPESFFPEDSAGRFRLSPFRAWRMHRYKSSRLVRYLLYPIALYRQVVREWEGGKPDVIWVQHAVAAPAGAWLKRRWGSRLVLNELDLLTGYLEKWPLGRVLPGMAAMAKRWELRMPVRYQADVVLAVSDALRDRLVRAGVSPDRVCAIYYGYDASAFRFQEEPSPRSGWVVMHGSFDYHHLGPIAREAVLRVLAQRSESRFRFVGVMTPSLKRLLDRVKARGWGDRVEATGFVPYERVPSLLREASVGIVPYEDSEGAQCAFVAKVVEYLGLGMPVVSTDLEGIRRYFAGRTPLLRWTAMDPAAFAEGVLEWLEKAETLRRQAARETSRWVARELDWSAVCRRAVDFMETRMGTVGEKVHE